ncbi:c-type cytochrome [Shewanella eurypsychrophilus]|uniref:C-type cytochrome n=1 Tax=Shewanella eurypsychrophilus TaxID=2593656 RepID=A0ABX6VAV4_9GAMM|nr:MULTISPECIES: c-type cytochrome [Shewanella]QFU24543.1 c-type cytochrome [Shewanella sp. YLB-09]QPG59738.1 c-type cytochrome [Shewanella eurypsychrophilus]
MTRVRKLPSLFVTILFYLASSTYASADEKALITQGEMLYNQNCVFCHQADAIGKTGFAPSLSNPELLAIASDKYLASTIRDGRIGTAMGPYAHLGKEKIVAIVAYLRSHETLPHRSAEVDKQRSAQGDARKGELWYHDICSTCHGPQGDGYLAGSSGTAIGKAGFLSKASDGFIRETIKYGRSNTRMLPFYGSAGLANLDEQEIEDIITYLRTLNK